MISFPEVDTVLPADPEAPSNARANRSRGRAGTTLAAAQVLTPNSCPQSNQDDPAATPAPGFASLTQGRCGDRHRPASD